MSQSRILHPLPVAGEGRVRVFLQIAALALTPTLSRNRERESESRSKERGAASRLPERRGEICEFAKQRPSIPRIDDLFDVEFLSRAKRGSHAVQAFLDVLQ